MSPIFVHSQVRESKTSMHLDKPPPSLQQLLTAITLYEFVAGFIIICKSTWFWRSLKGGNSIFFYVKGFQIINLYSWGSLETLMQNSPFNPTIRYPWTSPHQVGGRHVNGGNFLHFCEWSQTLHIAKIHALWKNEMMKMMLHSDTLPPQEAWYL